MKHAEISSTNPRSVLVVDDDAQCRRLIVRLLRELGYGVTFEAPSATAALSFLARTRPGIVLTDVVMEHQDSGLEVVRRACATGVPVAVVAGAPPWSEADELRLVPCLSKEGLTLTSLHELISKLLASA
jgi:CheY-like chemotaxis protein